MTGLVIFDNDGVLVDSETISCRVELELLAELGHPIDAATFIRRAVGTSSKDVRAMLESHWGRALPQDYPQRLLDRARAAFVRELQPMPGMAGLLADLTLPYCVASSGTPERIAMALEATGLARFFTDRCFSASAVARGKPAPDLFLYAASQMGVAPADCLVVEDSVPGVMGAKAAGMTVAGFLGGSHLGAGHGAVLREAGADFLVADAPALAASIARRNSL